MYENSLSAEQHNRGEKANRESDQRETSMILCVSLKSIGDTCELCHGKRE